MSLEPLLAQYLGWGTAWSGAHALKVLWGGGRGAGWQYEHVPIDVPHGVGIETTVPELPRCLTLLIVIVLCKRIFPSLPLAVKGRPRFACLFESFRYCV